MPALALENVSVSYPGATGRTEALRNVSLEIAAGQSLLIVGPSGCGKSTLLQLLAGLIHPDCGAAVIEGAAIVGPRRRTAFILQDYGLLPWKTVLENAALGLLVSGERKIAAFQKALAALQQVGLGTCAQSWPHELSGGMRQRVALARALAVDADLLLADEPLSALDALAREEMQDLLLELWRAQGYTQILVTHSVEEAAFLGRRIAVLSRCPGEVLAVVDNPGFGKRDSEAYFAICKALRSLLSPAGVPGGREPA
jgi:NitT/TauT family transport system ATP-binding protein